MKIGYSASTQGFLNQDPNAVVAALKNTSQSVILGEEPDRYTETWRLKIVLLQKTLAQLKDCSGWDSWHIVLECPIPWTVQHIDAILLARDLIMVAEIRLDRKDYREAEICQVEDFCLKLRDFHPSSAGCDIVPILVATDAPSTATHHTKRYDLVEQVFLANRERLTQIVGYIVESYTQGLPPIDPQRWESEEIACAPTVIDVAQKLFADEETEGSLVSEDSAALPRLLDIVRDAKKHDQKAVCFVNGCPGSGKTVTSMQIAQQEDALYLSSNSAFVDLIQRSLLREPPPDRDRGEAPSRRDTRAFIRELYHFFDEYYGGSVSPEQRIIVWDDAQRSRDAKLFPKKYVRHRTEPALMLDIMNRFDGWAVVIAMMDPSQVLTVEELSHDEWLDALKEFPDWQVAFAPELSGEDGYLKELPPEARCDERLSLSTCMRAASNTALERFVAAILGQRPNEAREVLNKELGDFPVLWTRSLSKAKRWLREKRRGKERAGLIASTGAKRLKAAGLEVADRFDVNWYLAPPGDVRSCSHLEVACRERHIQGLDLDWAGVCWDADFRHDSATWQHMRFHASSWLLETDTEAMRAIENRYHTLLTRARKGMVIWIPEGDADEPTCLPAYYEDTAEYLLSCGIPKL